MDHTEMLLAAHVRELAKALKQAEKQGFVDTLPKMPSEELRAQINQWSKTRPLSDYIPIAFSELKQVAAQIRSLA